MDKIGWLLLLLGDCFGAHEGKFCDITRQRLMLPSKITCAMGRREGGGVCWEGGREPCIEAAPVCRLVGRLGGG